jgi:hypothetical protein
VQHNIEGVGGYYSAALQEGVMRVRLCDVPLGLLGSLATGNVPSLLALLPLGMHKGISDAALHCWFVSIYCSLQYCMHCW